MSERDDIVPAEFLRPLGTSILERPTPAQELPLSEQVAAGLVDTAGEELPPPTADLGQATRPKPMVDLAADVAGEPPVPPIVIDGVQDGLPLPGDEIPSETFPDWEKSDDMPMPRPQDLQNPEDPNDNPDAIDPQGPPQEKEPALDPDSKAEDHLDLEPQRPAQTQFDPLGELSPEERVRRAAQGLPPVREPLTLPPFDGATPDPLGPISDEERARRVSQGLPSTPPPLTVPEDLHVDPESVPGYVPSPGEPYLTDSETAEAKPKLTPSSGGTQPVPYEDTNVAPPQVPETETFVKRPEPLDHM